MCDEAGGCQSVELPDDLGNFRGVCPSKSGEPDALRNGISSCPRLRIGALSYSARYGLNPDKFGGRMTHPEACLAPHNNYHLAFKEAHNGSTGKDQS